MFVFSEVTCGLDLVAPGCCIWDKAIVFLALIANERLIIRWESMFMTRECLGKCGKYYRVKESKTMMLTGYETISSIMFPGQASLILSGLLSFKKRLIFLVHVVLYKNRILPLTIMYLQLSSYICTQFNRLHWATKVQPNHKQKLKKKSM